MPRQKITEDDIGFIPDELAIYRVSLILTSS